jgi:hypothetical protein
MPLLPEWVHRLQHGLYPFTIPISFGPKPRRGAIEIHSATAFLVELGARPFLVTAGHVAEALSAALSSDPTLFVMLGNHKVALAPADIRVARSPIDLATITITDRLAGVLATDYEIVRPPVWPPPELREGDPVIFCGFPTGWRIVGEWADVDFRAILSLALIRTLNPDEFLCHLDPAYLEERQEPTAVEGLPALQSLGGLSGAPAFLVRNEDPKTLVIPQLCGVLKAGEPEFPDAGHRLIYFTRLDRLRADGAV